MKKGETVILDLSGCRFVGELHSRIKSSFGFPDYYGETWDACLDAFRTVGVPEKIEIRGEKGLPEALTGQVARMHQTFDKIKTEFSRCGWAFDYEIAD